MKYIFFLLLHASFVNMLQLDVGTEPGLPSCASRCMVDSMFVTPCVDMTCLCHEKEYQRSLFQCLFSQCDPADYGPSLSRTIASCLATGAEIYMVAPGSAVDRELLRAREAAYLSGREPLPEVPGLQLRQESVGGAGPGPGPAVVATTTVTVLVPVPPTPSPEQDQDPNASARAGAGAGAITPFAGPTPTPTPTEAPAAAATSSLDRPWMITRSVAARPPAASSFAGLVLWLGVVLVQDYWINGY
ncbi:hypothetical protein F4809DRAFT_656566 [Biscogniauxia mediterranea]|nr:hypothetical protein F4809DRAFT_656566 [Biscogniauxia mediterranea]